MFSKKDKEAYLNECLEKALNLIDEVFELKMSNISESLDESEKKRQKAILFCSRKVARQQIKDAYIKTPKGRKTYENGS